MGEDGRTGDRESSGSVREEEHTGRDEGSAGDAVGDAARDTGDAVGDVARDMGDAAGDVAEGIGDAAGDLADGNENP